MSRVSVAMQELDKAEKYIKSKLPEDYINHLDKYRKLWGTMSQMTSTYYDDISSMGKGAVGFFVITSSMNIFIDSMKGEDTLKQIAGLVGDGLVLIASFTPVGRGAIELTNWFFSLNDKDLGSLFKKGYDGLKEMFSDYEEKPSITADGFIKVTMKDGTVYSRPIQDPILKKIYGKAKGGSLFGDTKDDVLFGGNGNDMLIGHGGKDILIGGNGKDDYFVDNGDIIKDSDGNGRVFLENHQLTGGTQIEKGSQIYKGKDGTKYELKGSDLIINDSITIENFSKISNDLGIVLVDVDDIVVTIGNNQSTEGGNGKHSMEFKITLNRALKKDEFLELIINGQRIKFKEGDIEQTYTHTWDGNTIKEEDRKFEVSGIVMQTSENLNVQAVVSGQGLIKDDDKDPNDDKPETYDPLAIDLNNDGIKGTNLDYKINFDLDNNGFKEATSWIDNNDAFIAIDKNNNGAIDNGSELFGNKSISNNAYAYTNPNAKNGFESLKELDSNNDGIIDEKDKEFTNLLLWQDKNSNGISETDELIKLSDKVKSINLNYTKNGNTEISSATLQDGSSVKVQDMYFNVDLKKTEEIIDENQIPFEIKSLPNVKAFGNLKEFANLNLLVA